jgi:signal transduction histidine kinase
VLGLGVLIALSRLRQRLREAESDATRRRAEAAAAADRAKTAFLAKVSHELRTPIQGILGYSEMLRGADLPEEQSRRVEAVHSQGELLIRLVNDLIDLSAIQAGAFRLVERPGALAAHVREVVESLRPLAHTKNLIPNSHSF